MARSSALTIHSEAWSARRPTWSFSYMLVFMKGSAHRAQREYRFVVWWEQEPSEDRLDLPVSQALLEAMRTRLQDSDGRGVLSAGKEESSTVEAIHDGQPRATLQRRGAVGLRASDNPAVGLRRYDVEPLPGDLRETALVYATVEALRNAVARSAAGLQEPRRGTPSRSCGSSALPWATASRGCG